MTPSRALAPPPSPHRRSLVLGAMAAAAAPMAWAQSAADAPVRLVVPFTPGTGIDLIARQIAQPLSERLKRPFFVDNKAGASGIIGTQEVVRATPDGTTLLVSVNTLVMNMALYPKQGFNPLTDLAPVAQTSWGQLLLVTSVPLLHGGYCLYNGGLTAAFICLILMPTAEELLPTRKQRRLRKAEKAAKK